MPQEDKQKLTELKQLQLKTIMLDVDMQKEMYKLEKSFESKRFEVLNKRAEIIREFYQKAPSVQPIKGQPAECGDRKGISALENNNNISSFWLSVLKTSFTDFITKKDEEILKHLLDIRSTLHVDPTIKFVIEFQFAPNEYFLDSFLTKTYFLNCHPDADDPFSYDGPEIYKCEGYTINWKNEIYKPQGPTKAKDMSLSFFNFFSPPELPNDKNDPKYNQINTILQNDFELGFYLKERVIPKALLFFTGEIEDYLDISSDSDEDSDTEDETESSSATDSGHNRV